jgi:hypothetical protein
MDVIIFLCVWLGSSTVQFHDSLGSRRTCSEGGFSSQNGDCAWEVYYQRTAFCCAFFVAKAFNANDIHTKCFLFTVGSVCRIKWLTTGSRIFSRTFESCRWCPTRSPYLFCDRSNNSQKTSMLRVSTHW